MTHLHDMKMKLSVQYSKSLGHFNCHFNPIEGAAYNFILLDFCHVKYFQPELGKCYFEIDAFVLKIS